MGLKYREGGRTVGTLCPNVRYPGTVRFPGFFCCVKSLK